MEREVLKREGHHPMAKRREEKRRAQANF